MIELASYIVKTGASFSGAQSLYSQELQDREFQRLTESLRGGAPARGFLQGFAAASAIPAAFMLQPYLTKDHFESLGRQAERRTAIAEVVKTMPGGPELSPGEALQKASVIDQIALHQMPEMASPFRESGGHALRRFQRNFDRAVVGGSIPAPKSLMDSARRRVDLYDKHYSGGSFDRTTDEVLQSQRMRQGITEAGAIKELGEIRGSAMYARNPGAYDARAALEAAYHPSKVTPTHFSEIIERGKGLYEGRTGKEIPAARIALKTLGRQVMRNLKIPAAFGILGGLVGAHDIYGKRGKLRDLQKRAKK